MEVYWFRQCLGERFSPISTFFFSVSSRASRDASHSLFWCWDLKLCLLDFLKMLDSALFQICPRVFHLWYSVALDNGWIEDSRPFIFSFSVVCFRASSNAAKSRFWFGDPKLCLRGSSKYASFGPPPNLHKSILLVKVCRFWTVLRLEILAQINFLFLSLVSYRAFIDARHSRFKWGDSNECLPNFVKMLPLALPLIYTRVCH